MKKTFSMLAIPQFISQSNITAFTGPKELFVMLVLLFVFLYGMSIGKTRALLSLLSVYVALTLINLFPFFEQVNDAAPDNFQPYILKAGLFLVLFIGVFLILHHSSLKRLGIGELAMWKVFLISFIQIGFIAAVLASFIPEATAREKLSVIYPFVGSSLALFCWSVASLAILPFMRHRRD